MNKQPEFQQQAALFAWARNPAVVKIYPALRLLSSSLNGVKLTIPQAARAKAAGMLRGEWDVKLPVARGPYIGLLIEMKAGRNKLTEEQAEYGRLMALEGWCTAVCYDWQVAKDTILNYLSMRTPSQNG